MEEGADIEQRNVVWPKPAVVQSETDKQRTCVPGYILSSRYGAFTARRSLCPCAMHPGDGALLGDFDAAAHVTDQARHSVLQALFLCGRCAIMCHPLTPQMKETPLIRCAHNGHLQAVKLLLAKGADVNSLDLVGREHGCTCQAVLRLPISLRL